MAGQSSPYKYKIFCRKEKLTERGSLDLRRYQTNSLIKAVFHCIKFKLEKDTAFVCWEK